MRTWISLESGKALNFLSNLDEWRLGKGNPVAQEVQGKLWPDILSQFSDIYHSLQQSDSHQVFLIDTRSSL